MAYSKLNYIENQIGNHVIASGSTETAWRHYGSYSKKHPTGKWTVYETKTLASSGEAAVHTLTTIKQSNSWLWKNKSETIGGRAKQQYFKIKTGDTVLNGFLSLIPDSYFSNIADKYSRVYVCEGANASATLKQNAAATIPQPDKFNVVYNDFDSIKSGSGKDVIYTTGINRNEATGYLTRNRKRANIRTLEISWSMLTDVEAKKILEKVDAGQWMLVNFLDPLTNQNISKSFCLTGKSIEASYRNTYRNLSVTYEEV